MARFSWRSAWAALAIAFILWSSGMAPCSAADPASSSVSAEGFDWQDYQDPGPRRPAENPLASTVGFLLKFGAVVGLIYGVAWLYRRGVIPKSFLLNSPMGPGTSFKVLDSIPLRGTQSLHLVEVGDRVIVVGSNGRETLVKLTEWGRGRRFDTALDQAEAPSESDFTSELESTIQQITRPERGRHDAP